jgi:hypothetical protein
MAGTIQLVGVYPVDTVEPVHLVEVIIDDPFDDIDFGSFTQEPLDIVTADVAAGEDIEENDATAHFPQAVEDLGGGQTRVVFFFHALDPSRPLESPFGPLQLPAPTDRPGRLSAISYGPPF